MTTFSAILGTENPKIKEITSALVDMDDSGLIEGEEAACRPLEILEGCKVVVSSVQDGSFTQEEALEAYQVTYNDYRAYLTE